MNRPPENSVFRLWYSGLFKLEGIVEQPTVEMFIESIRYYAADAIIWIIMARTKSQWNATVLHNNEYQISKMARNANTRHKHVHTYVSFVYSVKVYRWIHTGTQTQTLTHTDTHRSLFPPVRIDKLFQSAFNQVDTYAHTHSQLHTTPTRTPTHMRYNHANMQPRATVFI